jgi:O-antigen ligase
VTPAAATAARGVSRFDTAALWIAVALGFTIPISTALDSVLLGLFLLCWAAGGRYRDKFNTIRGNAFALAACAFFLLHVVGAAYSIGSGSEILRALDKAGTILLVPLLVALAPGSEWRDRALVSFMAATALILALSFLVWLGLMPQAGFIKGTELDAVVFRLKITHSVLMAFAAFILALKAREASAQRAKLLWTLAAVIAAFNALVMVQSRTGQLVVLALLVYFLVSSMGRRGMVLAAASLLAIVAVTVLAPSSPLHHRTKTTITEIEEWRAGKPAKLANLRLESWSNSLEIVKRHPLVGVGTGGFAAAYAEQVAGTSLMRSPQPENQYLLTTVQLGLVGLVAVLALFAAQWHFASRLATRMDTDLARGLVLTLAVGCLFNSFLLDHAESLFFALQSGLLYSSLRPRNAASPLSGADSGR